MTRRLTLISAIPSPSSMTRRRAPIRVVIGRQLANGCTPSGKRSAGIPAFFECKSAWYRATPTGRGPGHSAVGTGEGISLMLFTRRESVRAANRTKPLSLPLPAVPITHLSEEPLSRTLSNHSRIVIFINSRAVLSRSGPSDVLSERRIRSQYLQQRCQSSFRRL